MRTLGLGCLAACVGTIASVGTGRADPGAYVAASYGFAGGRGRLAELLGTTLHLRVGFGMRLGRFAIEPWVVSELQTDRGGARFGLVGGAPLEGKADLETLGVDAKYVVALDRRLAVFVRAGPLVTDGTGALDGFHGRGVGFGGGVQLTGRVRALGLLWAPLLFWDRGPMVTGALFLDAGQDFYFLRGHGQAIDARVDHLSAGFAVGSAF